MAPTLCIDEFKFAIPSPKKPKSKKNPSIRVNGEKVLDSDIEEKKEKANSSPSNLLSVSGSQGKLRESKQGGKEDNESSAVNEDIFYTCPLI